jgi:hypothetical protein
MFGGDNTDRDYAPHMWLGDHFIHNSGKTIQIGDWWYRTGRLHDETIVAERWKGGQFPHQGQAEYEMVPSDQLPTELQSVMERVSRAEQEALQRRMEEQLGRSQ